MRHRSVSAPTRIADLGGWTDTWFSRHGIVCHLAVWPGVDVTVREGRGAPGVDVRLHNFDPEWHWSPGTDPRACPDPLVGASLDEAGVPEGAWVLEIGSHVSPGASMGTSASLCVAVIAALDALGSPDGVVANGPDALAALVRRAHAAETVRLGQQSGIQDQWAAAAGGINLIEMTAYPDAERREVAVPPAVREQLEEQLVVVLLEQGHDSSAVHGRVVDALASAGPDDARLEALRSCARDGAAALVSGDLAAYGDALCRNTDAQAALQPDLVSAGARAVIDVARQAGVFGWKVNGAGGAGGSVTVLARDQGSRADFEQQLAEGYPRTRLLPVRLAGSGVYVRDASDS